MTARKQLYHLLRGYITNRYAPEDFCERLKKIFRPELVENELSEQECTEFERLAHAVAVLTSEYKSSWTEAEGEALRLAVEEIYQRLMETGGDQPYEHDEAVRYAKELITQFSSKELAKDFLYGVAHNAPEYRTALASYYFIKNLPEHEFKKLYIGFDGRHRYDPHTCEICEYFDHRPPNPQLRFHFLQTDMRFFYYSASVPYHFCLDRAITYLEEYRELPRPAADRSDYEYFRKIIAVIENVPENTTSGKLCKELKASGCISMTKDQIAAFVDMLGYLNILHPDDCFGVTVKHTQRREMKDPLSLRSYAAYPVNRWTRRCGIDYGGIAMLFDGIYD